MRRALFSLAAAAALTFSVSATPPNQPPENWPQWRGPGGAGLGRGEYPASWSASDRIAWKAEIPGKGHSSPVIWGNRLFITTAIQGDQIPGRKAPDHLGFDFKPGYLHPDSVGVDYANTLKVLALDTDTGKIVWERTVYIGLMYDN